MNAARVTFFDEEPQARRLLRTHFLETVLDQLSDAVVLYDKNLEIVGVNQAAERLFGMMAEEITGQCCKGLFHCTPYEPDGSAGQAVAESTCLPAGTFNLHVKNGRHRMVVIRTVELCDDANAVEGVVATIKDITEESHPVVRRIVAESQAMRDLLDFVRKIAVSEATSVLIEGENGTGKDLIAKTLHDQSPRQAEAFLAINCAAIPETLLESELFGFEKGAFTDARAQKRGLFELADKGTLFLDEIGEMSLSLQAKLLRVLEDQTFRRLGGLRDLKVDIRIVAATNKNMSEALKEGAFRQDLYYRLSVIQLVVPPLRERPQDILPLARFFVQHYNVKFKQQIEGLSSEAESLLLTYTWPGNVRELRNAIERAMILEDTAYIRSASLQILAGSGESAFASAPADGAGPGAGDALSLRGNERRMLKHALDMAGGNQTQAARLLRITRDTLRYKMKKFELFREDDAS
ncbi:MAG TPA: sigma 54-interacting transcriptional regulator [Bryobacteraceae bacterium]|nr:sigma 54-interacting transcriptional regulator [Bryobacteraceae bacterium]